MLTSCTRDESQEIKQVWKLVLMLVVTFETFFLMLEVTLIFYDILMKPSVPENVL